MSHYFDVAVRVFNLSAFSVALGFAMAIGWNWRNRQTVPPYVKVMGFSYCGFALFSIATTQAALRRDAPVTWVTWLGAVAAVAGVVSTFVAWRESLK